MAPFLPCMSDTSNTEPRRDLDRGIVLYGAEALMRFFGLPLAHVAQWEEWKREQQLQRNRFRRRVATFPPPPHFRA
jgi:hypothetical protein